MTDDLRLRTARALNVKMYYEEEFPGERYYYYAEGERKHQPIAAYGESWASCKEIDAACKEREWRAQIDMDEDETRVCLFTTINGLIGTRLSAAYAPTLPAAFALAFCEAVEAGHE